MLLSFGKPSVQATFASTIGLVAAIMQRELKPYRRPRDDAVALASQLTVYAWCVTLLLVRVRVLQVGANAPVSLIGLALVAVSLALGGYALALTVEDFYEFREPPEESKEGRSTPKRISAESASKPLHQGSPVKVLDEILEVSGANPLHEGSPNSVALV